MKHQITHVHVYKAEGPHDTYDGPSLTDASKMLSRMSDTVPMGYDKCDFTVEWDDGEKYEGRYDLHHDEHGLNMIGEQIRNVLCFEIGLAHPTHLSKYQYEEYIARMQDCRVPYIYFLLTHDTGVEFGREITAEELADLPESWNNPKVDTRKYYQCAMRAWEVSEEVYNVYTKGGGLSQIKDGRYYVA